MFFHKIFHHRYKLSRKENICLKSALFDIKQCINHNDNKT